MFPSIGSAHSRKKVSSISNQPQFKIVVVFVELFMKMFLLYRILLADIYYLDSWKEAHALALST